MLLIRKLWIVQVVHKERAIAIWEAPDERLDHECRGELSSVRMMWGSEMND